MLSGGGGADSFFFSFGLGTGNVDTINDYNIAQDRFLLDDAVFAAFTPGAVSAANFRVFGTGEQDANDFLLYNQSNGAPFYDADGNGAGAAQLFAVVSSGLAMDAGEFIIV